MKKKKKTPIGRQYQEFPVINCAQIKVIRPLAEYEESIRLGNSSGLSLDEIQYGKGNKYLKAKHETDIFERIRFLSEEPWNEPQKTEIQYSGDRDHENERKIRKEQLKRRHYSEELIGEEVNKILLDKEIAEEKFLRRLDKSNDKFLKAVDKEVKDHKLSRPKKYVKDIISDLLDMKEFSTYKKTKILAIKIEKRNCKKTEEQCFETLVASLCRNYRAFKK